MVNWSFTYMPTLNNIGIDNNQFNHDTILNLHIFHGKLILHEFRGTYSIIVLLSTVRLRASNWSFNHIPNQHNTGIDNN